MTARESAPVQPRQLRVFQPLDRLTDDQLILLSSRAEFRQYRPGQSIAEQGTRDGLDLFLLEGEVALSARDGRTSTIAADSEAAHNPIARLQPRMYSVTATKPVRLMAVAQELVNHLLRTAPAEELTEAAEVAPDSDQDDTPAHDLLMEFYADLKANRLRLPSVPDVAFKVRRATERENATADDMAQVVSADPSIAAKLIRACNSALYRGVSETRTVREAVVRLGTRTTRQLVTMFAMREVFRAEHKQLQEQMDELWHHSREVAALCWVLADAATRLDPEEAMLAGLLHDIGMIPVYVFADQQAHLAGDLTEVAHVVDALRADVGAAVLENWSFPEAFVRAARHAENWEYEAAEEEPQLADVVIVAQLHAMIHGQRNEGLPHFSEVPAYRRLGELTLSASRSLELLHQAEDRVSELQSLLRG
ncbi:cyclic nucleotide-binding protein [Tamilnaduibacter salinus]|uniref:Cyclic nucleotide-binding protein n=1 Tax=Tamilnaduibacter salinus TaxID=1484056 RepID=A0A2A2I4R5_9GAMM|nr:HDOD domain-containing protein [Tamilnaduibacter salinus]PAV26013.1 cyclic nucleotide-binding protein [Tamilnaduibacter salinus]